MRAKRWLYAVDGIIALLFLGLIYAWSVFVGPLEAEFGWLRSETSLTFSISMAAFCIGGIAGGLLSKKIPSQAVLMLAAAFILAGFLLVSNVRTLPGLYICYGVLCGFGVGMGYNAVLNGVLRWFPDKQGAMSGILLMGFGFGGMVLGSAAVLLMSHIGWRATFRTLGIVLGALIVLAALLLKKPTEDDLRALSGTAGARPPAAGDVPTGKMVKTRSFWGYFIWSALLSSAGLALIGNAASFAGTFTDNLATATFVAGLINIANGLGRLGFGFLFDLLGSKKTLVIITGGLFAAMLVLMGAVGAGSIGVLAAGFVVAGVFYGGITPSNSAFASRVFGQKFYPLNLSATNMVLLVAAFMGPSISGFLQTKTGGFFSTLVMLAIFCALGLPALLLIQKHAPARKGSTGETAKNAT